MGARNQRWGSRSAHLLASRKMSPWCLHAIFHRYYFIEPHNMSVISHPAAGGCATWDARRATSGTSPAFWPAAFLLGVLFAVRSRA